jgi:hypothetical protein
MAVLGVKHRKRNRRRAVIGKHLPKAATQEVLTHHVAACAYKTQAFYAACNTRINVIDDKALSHPDGAVLVIHHEMPLQRSRCPARQVAHGLVAGQILQGLRRAVNGQVVRRGSSQASISPSLLS